MSSANPTSNVVQGAEILTELGQDVARKSGDGKRLFHEDAGDEDDYDDDNGSDVLMAMREGAESQRSLQYLSQLTSSGIIRDYDCLFQSSHFYSCLIEFLLDAWKTYDQRVYVLLKPRKNEIRNSKEDFDELVNENTSEWATLRKVYDIVIAIFTAPEFNHAVAFECSVFRDKLAYALIKRFGSWRDVDVTGIEDGALNSPEVTPTSKATSGGNNPPLTSIRMPSNIASIGLQHAGGGRYNISSFPGMKSVFDKSASHLGPFSSSSRSLRPAPSSISSLSTTFSFNESSQVDNKSNKFFRAKLPPIPRRKAFCTHVSMIHSDHVIKFVFFEIRPRFINAIFVEFKSVKISMRS
jgi:hypothetical protein